jgi:hypothetical protein
MRNPRPRSNLLLFSRWLRILINQAFLIGKEFLPNASESITTQKSNDTVNINYINKFGTTETVEAIVNEVEIFPHSEVNITENLPKEVAILYIQSEGDNCYRLIGGNAEIPLPLTESQKKPKLSLGESVQAKLSPEDIRDDMNHFSRVNPKIRKWLKQLRKKFGRRLCLVISDQTNFEIPWEMLELSPDESDSEYLGALVTTVRWQQVIRGDDELVLEIKADECFGKAIAYTNHKELNVGVELSILKKLNATTYDNITKFHSHLQRDDLGFGLIYIAGHGTFSENHREIAIGSLQDPNQQLKLRHLNRCAFNLLKKSKGIVFINTCHSGRYQTHSCIPSDYRIGFVELFLRKGARGVIGTLGGVGDRYAAEIARDLMQACMDSPSLSVAALLRDIRAKVVADLAAEQTQDNLLAFIYTFMYVYYGNPMTVLRLTPSGGQTND